MKSSYRVVALTTFAWMLSMSFFHVRSYAKKTNENTEYAVFLPLVEMTSHPLAGLVYVNNQGLWMINRAGLFDYTENILIIRMLKTYPNLNSSLVTAASFATVAKSILSSVFFTLLILSILQVIWKSLFKMQRVQS